MSSLPTLRPLKISSAASIEHPNSSPSRTNRRLAVRSLPPPHFLFGRRWKTRRENEEEVVNIGWFEGGCSRSREEEDQNREMEVD
ncbi:hypothetical protein Syun_020201 [Stephania yunnanensis]|uniref:Uncharacterized protein n=1 Tax=Stephania yunnanensis TaxID=152371 RepID=A0AAP0IDE6_9MAGN